MRRAEQHKRRKMSGLWDFTKMSGMVRKLQKVVAEGGGRLNLRKLVLGIR